MLGFGQVIHASSKKTVEALVEHFDISENLAQVAIKTTPIVLISDLSQQEASSHVKKLKAAGDFRVWLSSATSRMKKMSFKIREIELSTN